MTADDVKVGQYYSMPSGINRKVVMIGVDSGGWEWVRLETLNGKRPGSRTRESMEYFLTVAEPMVE